MSKKKWIWIVLAILLVGGVFLWNKNKDTSNKEVVRIGINIPMTGSLSTYGKAIRDGVLLAYDELDGKANNIELYMEDNKSEAKNSAIILKKHLINPISIYVSGVKPQTMSIIEEVSSKEIPHFVWIFDAFITNQPNVYRTWVNYKIEPLYYFKYIEKVQPKRIALTYVQLPHTDEEFKQIIEPYLKENNYEYMIEPYQLGTNDVKSIGAKMKSFKPDLIILNGFKDDLIAMVKHFKEIGLSNSEGNTICTYDFLDASEDLSASIKVGIRFIAPEFVSTSTTTQQDWTERFKEKFNRNPRYTDAYAYDMFNLIFQASKKVQDFSNAKEWEAALKSINTDGITGKLMLDASGDLEPSIDVVYYQNDKLVVDIE